MSILEKITNDLKIAMKSKDKIRVETLRSVIAQLKNERINVGNDLSPEQELAVLMNAAKKRKEAIDIYEKSNRKDLLDKEKSELEIISEYLPEQISDEAIEKSVSAIIERTGATSVKDIGRVMGEAMKELKGKADGKKVQQMVRSKLA